MYQNNYLGDQYIYLAKKARGIIDRETDAIGRERDTSALRKQIGNALDISTNHDTQAMIQDTLTTVTTWISFGYKVSMGCRRLRKSKTKALKAKRRRIPEIINNNAGILKAFHFEHTLFRETPIDIRNKL